MTTPITAGHPVHFLDENGRPYGIKQIDGKPRVSAMSYYADIAEGNVSDHTALIQLGHNGVVGTAEEIVAPQGASQLYMSSAEKLQVVSSSGDDDAGGTGALTVTVYGLDSDWNEQSETVTMNGATAVETDGTYIRVTKAIVVTAGTGLKNAGTIDVMDNGETDILVRIGTGQNQSACAIWSVPDGNTLFLVAGDASSATNKGSQILFYVRPFGGLFLLQYILNLYGGSEQILFPMPFKIAAKSDVEVRAKAVAAGDDIAVVFHGWYES